MRAEVEAKFVADDQTVLDEVATELNVKALEDVDTLSGLLSWTIVPSFRALGPRLGPRVNDVKQALDANDGAAINRTLDTLMQAQAKAAQELYSQASASSDQGTGSAAGSAGGAPEGDVIDAEVIDDEKAEKK